jgi:hypothetical protein
MTRPAWLVVGALLLSLGTLSSACSGKSGDERALSTRSSTATATPDARATLIAAARDAIDEDHRMSVRVLWTNSVPTKPRATAGPALAVLRRSVAVRARRGIRVRLVAEHFRVIRIDLDSSYQRATAIVSDPQRVRPYGRDGRPLGHAVKLNERARLELRRLGSSTRFVVWRVTAIT